MANVYRVLLKKVRTVRDSNLAGLRTSERAKLKAAYRPILSRLEAWKKETTRRNSRARERQAGLVSSVTEGSRIEAIEGWVARGCRIEE